MTAAELAYRHARLDFWTDEQRIFEYSNPPIPGAPRDLKRTLVIPPERALRHVGHLADCIREMGESLQRARDAYGRWEVLLGPAQRAYRSEQLEQMKKYLESLREQFERRCLWAMKEGENKRKGDESRDDDPSASGSSAGDSARKKIKTS